MSPRQDVNQVTLHGNLTADPEAIADGKGARLRVAFSTAYKSGDEWASKSHFATVKVWGGQAKPCMEHLRKGSEVVLAGRLELEQWETDGNKRSELVVVAQQVQFLGAPAGDKGNASDSTDAPW